MVTGFILSAGDATHFWGLPKQSYVKIDGESLMDRMDRQFKDRVDKLFLVTHRSELYSGLYGCWLMVPEHRRCISETLKSTRHKWSDRILVLLGDVYFTEEAKDMILNYQGPFGIFSDRIDLFALSVEKNRFDDLDQALTKASKYFDETNEDGHGRLNWAMSLLKGKPDWIWIEDKTQDFDSPQEYERFLEGKSKNHSKGE